MWFQRTLAVLRQCGAVRWADPELIALHLRLHEVSCPLARPRGVPLTAQPKQSWARHLMEMGKGASAAKRFETLVQQCAREPFAALAQSQITLARCLVRCIRDPARALRP